jgi:hypothetical protein
MIAKFMHHEVLRATRVAFGATSLHCFECDEFSTLDN